MKLNVHSPRQRQAGVALIVALIMLLLITLIGLAAARNQGLETRMASNTQNRNKALQNAETGLRNAEDGLQQGIYKDFTGNTGGLFALAPNATTLPQYLCITTWPIYANATLPGCGATATATTLTSTDAGINAHFQFIIEQLPSVVSAGGSISTCQYNCGTPPVQVYRITSYGYGTGGDTTTSVVLQSIFQ
jgi:type IV pilus assembly protein PilX